MPHDGADPAVEVDAEGVLLARQLAVEVDEADGGQLVGAVVEERVEHRERVLDLGCMYVRPWALMTATSVPSWAWKTPQPRPGTPVSP